MAFTAAIKYIKLNDPTSFQIQDVSNYAAPDNKANISARTLTILDSTGAPLAGFPNPIAFPYIGGDLFTVTGLTTDLALTIVMALTPISPQGGSTYTAEADIATNRFLEVGLYNIQVQRLNTTNPASSSDKQYRINSIDILIEMSNSQIAVGYSNYTGAQEALDRGTNIILNTTL